MLKFLKGVFSSRFLDPYYVLNVTSILSVLAVRHLMLGSGNERIRESLVKWEQQALLLLGSAAAYRFWRAVNFDAFFADLFIYCQLLVIAVSFMVDKRICAWYCVAFGALDLLCVQPPYRGRWTIRMMTQRQLETVVADGPKGSAWLVAFHTTWSSRCKHLDPIFADLAHRYESSLLQFGQLDVGLFPAVAQDLLIDSGMFSAHLPTFILFEGGAEVARFPSFSTGHSALKRFKKEDLVRVFELDVWHLRHLKSRYLATLSSGSSTVPPASKRS